MSINKLLPLAKQLMFGVDTTIGLSVFIIFSFSFGQPASLIALMIAGFCAYAPDLDLIPFMLLRKKLVVTVGHWVFGHYPVIVLPAIASTLWLVAHEFKSGHEAYLVVMGTTCTLAHFCHDCLDSDHEDNEVVKKGGFHLLAPFTSDGRIRFTLHEPWIWAHYVIGYPFGIRRAPQKDVLSLYSETMRLAQGNAWGEITGRVEKHSLGETVAFAICIAGLGLLVAKNGFCL
jgi:hypothetical protein